MEKLSISFENLAFSFSESFHFYCTGVLFEDFKVNSLFQINNLFSQSIKCTYFTTVQNTLTFLEQKIFQALILDWTISMYNQV